MYAAKELPFNREDVKRAFKLLAGEEDPDGFITPEVLEKALVKHCSHKVSERERCGSMGWSVGECVCGWTVWLRRAVKSSVCVPRNGSADAAV